jgi:hypothetical protein
LRFGRGYPAAWIGLLGLVLAAGGGACDDGSDAPPRGNGGASGAGGSGGAGGAIPMSTVVVSAAARSARTTTWSVNYWDWMPSFGDDVTGTETLIQPLKAFVMRIGGYNNDANTPDPFDNDALDAAVAYARAIGAEPLIQVPHLADVNGMPPTADEAAAMVTYANVTKKYGIKYFSIGNEPDIYDTQGSLTDSTLPAIPGYTPAQFCASVEEFVPAMKAVDPTIQIVGPDLAYKYQPNGGDNDWLTPILQTCGDLFDIVSIHRYPFEAAAASLAAAEADLDAFRTVIGQVSGILTSTGYAAKPLALTEMNVVYDATTGCVLGASPGTVGSALWMADSIGTAIELGLWTTAVWDISDSSPYALGLLDVPPARTPRPEYYAYQLYADHVGPTLLEVTSKMPAGVSLHASRNQADDATEVIVSNWNATPVELEFQVTGLATAPAPPSFVLPAVSIAAVEIPDTGAAAAWSYAEAQRLTGSGPQLLTAGGTPAGAGGAAGTRDGGPAGVAVGTNCAADAAVTCSEVVLPAATITTAGTGSGAQMSFGSGSAKWGSYLYAGSGQTNPTASATSDGNGVQISATFVSPAVANNDYEGVGLYFNSSSCVDASSYTGVKFDLSGDLGGCSLAFGASFSGDLSHGDDMTRGACPGADATCYGPSFAVAVTPSASATTILVPFTSLSGGMPISTLDPTTITAVQWQVGGPAGVADGATAVANFTVENVAFY